MGVRGSHPSEPMGISGSHPSEPIGINGSHPSEPMGMRGSHPSEPMGRRGSQHGEPMGLRGSKHGQQPHHNHHHSFPDQAVSGGGDDDFDPLPFTAHSSEAASAEHVGQQRQQQIKKASNPQCPQQAKKSKPPAQPQRKAEAPAPAKNNLQLPNKENNDAALDAPLPLGNTANNDDANGELTLEEYRKSLSNYLVNNNIQTTENVYPTGDDDFSSVESWTEDVTQEHERPELDKDGKPVMDHSNLDHSGAGRRLRHSRAPPGVRRVDRNKSGQSMMSMKSTGTTLSGISMLSDMSMETNHRSSKMSHALGHSSNASIMSEMTDISQCIDDLTLEDE
jgi:hypothetical protein